MSDAAIFRATVEAALRSLPAQLDPYHRTRRALGRLDVSGTVAVVALGKASRAMAAAAIDVFANRVVAGVLVAPDDRALDRFEVHVGSHPLPDEASEAAGRAALRLSERSDHDHLVALISGGGSAMAEVPKRPLDITQLTDLTNRLLQAGTPIDELNVVRRHLSDFKNGGLSGRSKVPVTTLVISDVIDGPPSMVASGPTLRDASDALTALAIIERRLGRPVPPQIHTALATPVAHRDNETVVVVADRHTAFAVVAHQLATAGFQPAQPARLEGDAATMAHTLTAQEGLTIGTGETTVVVTGDGTGGRNQHGALAAAITIEGTDTVFASFGTDGVDGPTDAAGAVVDGGTAGAIRAAGIDPVAALENCDSHPALEAVGALIRTGPTGTNVADVWVCYVPATR